MIRFCTLLSLPLLLLSSTARAERPPVEEVVLKMQAVYNQTQDLQGKFKQVYTDTLYSKRRTSYGYLYVKKPGMMRWNYVSPERKAFIADGKELWVWEPEDKQAFKNPLSTDSLSSGLTFLLGQGDLRKEFAISYGEEALGGPDDLVLKLTPKQPTAQYSHIMLVVDPESHVVQESMVVSKHNTNHLIFSGLKFNTRLRSARFQFKPPADSRVIDGARLGR